MDRLRDFFQHRGKDWYERRAVYKLPLPENYLNGRLGFAIKLNVLMEMHAGEAKQTKYLVCMNSMVGNINITDLRPDNTCVLDFGNRKRWNQEVMLISNIKLIGDPDQEVPTLIRAYLVEDKIIYPLEGSALSEVSGKGVYEFLPSFAYRHREFFRPDPRGTSEPHPAVVKGGAHICGITSPMSREIVGGSGLVRWIWRKRSPVSGLRSRDTVYELLPVQWTRS